VIYIAPKSQKRIRAPETVKQAPLRGLHQPRAAQLPQSTTFIITTNESRPINKLQNEIILLIFKISKIPDPIGYVL